jgi:hypothetical protein
VEEECVEGGGDPLGVRVAALRAGGQVHGRRVAVGVHSSVRSSQMKEEIHGRYLEINLFSFFKTLTCLVPSKIVIYL